MTDGRSNAYAGALLAVARSEGSLAEVEDELFRFARVLETNDELRTTLTDAALPVSRRQQIVEDLLGGQANPLTTALLSMVVGAGRARDLTSIIDELVKLSAAEACCCNASVSNSTSSMTWFSKICGGTSRLACPCTASPR